MCPYDAVGLVEAPDDEAVTACSLAVRGQGDARTAPGRALEEAEMQTILGRSK